MEVTQHIDAIRRDGDLLAVAAQRAGWDAAVPSCPEWVVRDLVRHQGTVHRWAAANLRRDRDDPMTDDEQKAVIDTWPAEDAGLFDWFRDGHTEVVAALEAAPDHIKAFTFLPAPTPRAFWARRQAHETAIHRADAELATGAVTAYGAAMAADGIDEFVRGFASRKGKYVAEPARAMLLAPTDVATRWLLRIGPERLIVDDGAASDAAECTVEASASDLFLWVWNRRSTDGFTVSGDETLAALWRSTSGVRWT